MSQSTSHIGAQGDDINSAGDTTDTKFTTGNKEAAARHPEATTSAKMVSEPPTDDPTSDTAYATCIVINSDSEVLLLRRGPTAKWKPNVWNAPGGCIEADETAFIGALRELHEEAGPIVYRSIQTVVRLDVPAAGTHCCAKKMDAATCDNIHQRHTMLHHDGVPVGCFVARLSKRRPQIQLGFVEDETRGTVLSTSGWVPMSHQFAKGANCEPLDADGGAGVALAHHEALLASPGSGSASGSRVTLVPEHDAYRWVPLMELVNSAHEQCSPAPGGAATTVCECKIQRVADASNAPCDWQVTDGCIYYCRMLQHALKVGSLVV